MMSLEMKHEIIEKHEQCVHGVDLAIQYECSTSTICTKGVINGYETSQGHHDHLKTPDLYS